MRATRSSLPTSPLAVALRDCRGELWGVVLFSGAVNLLMLAGPLYMLQVYDRVLVSESVPTLVALSIFLVGAYVFQGVLDLIRSRIVVRSAALLDRHLGETVHRAIARRAIERTPGQDAAQPIRDLDQIRAFITGSGPLAILDLPWIPVFLTVCFLIHPVLGFVATAGGLVLVAIAALTERASRARAAGIVDNAITRMTMVEAARRNAETVVALGMEPALSARWNETNGRHVSGVQSAADIVTSYGALSKVSRLLLQSALLGVGAYLVIGGELLPGAMIAASVMMGRALAPLETATVNWRGFLAARVSARRLSTALVDVERDNPTLLLPAPAASLEVVHLSVKPPGGERPIVAGIHFSLDAREGLGIIGPSGAGKTSLVRALVGIWPAVSGSIRLDGAALQQWGSAGLGRHIGYVSQGADLFDGSVAENIARMQRPIDNAAVLHAARQAGAHEMIVRLPQGYETRVGEGGIVLSAGQRQRIALARALYGDPFLIVLDEPNANLDHAGEAALEQALLSARARGAIVIVVAHRQAVLASCDKLLLLSNGVQQAFGPSHEVLRQIGVSAPRPRVAGNLHIVSAGKQAGRAT